MTDLVTDLPTDEPAEPGPSGPSGGSHLARNAALCVGAVLVLLIVLLATDKQAAPAANPLIGKAVPVLAGTTLDGKKVSIDDYRTKGKWVVVNFLASWCVGCVEEHPDLVAFSKQHRAAGDAVILGVAFNDDPDKLRQFMAVNQGDWPVIMSDDGQAAIQFSVTAVPESFIVSPDGIVVAHAAGGVDLTWLNSWVGGGIAAESERQGDAPRQAGPGTTQAVGREESTVPGDRK